MSFYRKPFFWVFVFLIGVGVFFSLRKTLSAIEVKTAVTVRKDFEITVSPTSTGTVRSEQDVRVTAQRTGRVSRIYVAEGDAVGAGDAIAELDPEEALISYELSKASSDRMRASLDEAKTAFEPFKEEVENNIVRAEANLREAEERVKRVRGLFKDGYVSQSELDRVERDYGVAKANYDSAVSGRKQLESKALEIAVREASVREAEKAQSLAKLNHDYSFLRSPVAGIVASFPVKVGETVMKGAPVAALIQMGSLYVEVFIDEADVGRVKTGQAAHIAMDAYPGSAFRGEVYKLAPVVLGGKLEARTFEGRVRIIDKDTAFKPGMSADVEIIVDMVKDALIVPAQAVTQKDSKRMVYVKEGRRARLREISAGLSDFTNMQVLGGLEGGEEVIINPDVPGLKDGARVRAAKVAAAK